MSRKEHLKKSLGITEYPWSSDDEDPASTQAIPEVHILRRQVSEPRPSVADMPGTSVCVCPGQQAPTSPTLSPARRCPSKMTDRDMFLSLLSKDIARSRLCELPSLKYVSPLSWPPVVHTPPSELRESRAERPTAAADIQRMVPYKKLMRSFNTMRTSKSNSNLHAMSPRGSMRTPIYTPSAWSEAPACVKANRIQSTLKRLQASRSAMRWDNGRGSSFTGSVVTDSPRPETPRAAGAGAAPRTESWMLDEPVVVDEPSPHHADDVMELRENNDSQPAVDVIEAESEPIDVDITHTSSGGGVSLEEEIVEIDAPDDVDTVVNVTGDVDDNNDNVVNTDVGLNEAAAAPTNDDTVILQPHNHESAKRRRESNASPDEGEPYTVKEFNQSLLRLLECPVCLEWMEPPMSQCRRGHLVCARCRARLASCPVCRTTFSSVRNRAMEGVAEMVRYPCRHGCGREVRLRRRCGHESSCGARRYHCPAPACADRPPLPRDHLHQHFQGKHMSMLKIGRKHKFSMKVNSEQHDTWLITALHEYFYLRVDVDIRTWGVVVYVAYIGPKCNAKNFTYEVSVVGQHNSRRLVYARVTHSDLESSTLNVSRQDCFHLTLDQALNFLRFKNRHCEPEKFLDFNVEINKSEPSESRDDSDS